MTTVAAAAAAATSHLDVLVLQLMRKHIRRRKGLWQLFAVDWAIDASGRAYLIDTNDNPPIKVPFHRRDVPVTRSLHACHTPANASESTHTAAGAHAFEPERAVTHPLHTRHLSIVYPLRARVSEGVRANTQPVTHPLHTRYTSTTYP